MKRKCTICHAVTTDDRLVACPECGADFDSGEPDRNLLTPQQEKYIVRKIWRKHWTFLFGGFSVLTVISVALLALALITAYKSGTARLEKTLVERVAKEFEEPRIQEVVREVAAERASALMTKQVSPEVAKFKANLANQLKELHSLVATTRDLESKSRDHEKSIQSVLAGLQLSLQQSQEANKRLATIKVDLVEMQKCIATIQYYRMKGANTLPFPYHKETLAALNKLLAIAIPNPVERSKFIAELQGPKEPKK